MTEQKTTKGVSRREFVKGTAIGAAALGLAGLGAKEVDAASLPTKWDKETDIIVVGYGGAGAVAAITAKEEGAKVLVLEKAPLAGGSTGVCSGSMRVPDNAAQAAQFIKAVGLGKIDDEMASVFAEIWTQLPDWMKAHGAKTSQVGPTSHMWTGIFPGAESIKYMMSINRMDGSSGGVGRDLFVFLDKKVRELGAEVMLNTPAKRLIQNGVTKEIVGVIAESGGKQINIKAKKAVIMTCGGFSANREMMATYIEEAPIPIYVSGTPHHTGDGINMVLDVGAELWHMNGIEWGRDGLKPPELPAAFWLDFKAWSLIVVNKDGDRFKDESVSYGHAKKALETFRFDNSEKQRWPNYPCYYIFDEKTRLAGPILMTQRAPGRDPHTTYNVAHELYYVTDWSKDNSKEIGKGWIKQGNTLAELAKKTGINPAGLEAQVAKYNEYCATGKDPDLFRPKKFLVPLVTPPYYSVECAVNTINTQGGPRRNAKSQVMNPYGEPIPRLYAGGEFGSIWGYLYPGACNLPECIVSGRISGKNAAALKPWS